MLKKIAVVQSLIKRSQDFILAHQEVCVKIGKCLCVKGEAKSLHLPAGGKLKIPSLYVEASDFKNAERARPLPKIKVTFCEVQAEKEPEPTTEKPEKPESPAERPEKPELEHEEPEKPVSKEVSGAKDSGKSDDKKGSRSQSKGKKK